MRLGVIVYQLLLRKYWCIVLLSTQLVLYDWTECLYTEDLKIIARCHHYFYTTFNNFGFLMSWWTVKVVHCWALLFHLWVTMSHPWPHHLLWQDCWWKTFLLSPHPQFFSYLLIHARRTMTGLNYVIKLFYLNLKTTNRQD